MNQASQHLPLVSIAMATFNGEKYLDKQLDSIFNQDYPNLEIIVCDDCSNDNTVSLLQRYEQLPNISIHFNERNIGHVRNFEKALSLCSGEYIALSDQDDIWLPQKVSRLVTLAAQFNSYLVYSDASLIDESGQKTGKSLKKSYNINYISDNENAFYLFNCVTGCTSLIHRRLLDYAIPFPDGVIVHDWWLAFVAAKLTKLNFTDEQLTLYRVHDSNAIGIRPVSLSKTMQTLWYYLTSPKFRRESKVHLDTWKSNYHRFFSGCLAFEQANLLDTHLTEQLLEWSGKQIPKSAWNDLTMFSRNREVFQIVPISLRLPAILSKAFL